ncbi:hypothetical protein IJT93_04530, partial [bacterium]|nr:hypothetical protein [bacterium]
LKVLGENLSIFSFEIAFVFNNFYSCQIVFVVLVEPLENITTSPLLRQGGLKNFFYFFLSGSISQTERDKILRFAQNDRERELRMTGEGRPG